MDTRSDDTSSDPSGFDISEVFHLVWSKRLVVATGCTSFLVVGLVVALLWPRTYVATATVFPVASSSNSTLSDYAGLATLAGLNIPTGATSQGPGKTVNALLGSRLLIERLVKDLDLLTKIPTEGPTPEDKQERLVELLRDSLKAKEDTKTGVITVSIELPDAKLAQTATNQVLSILDILLVEKSFTTNRKKNNQLERQIQEQSLKVGEYQQQMARFQQETALLNPTAQASQAIEGYTSMIQQRMELELQLATAQASYSPANPRITVLKTQIESLDRQIRTVRNQVGGDLPSLKTAPEDMIRYQNLARDLEIATKIYAGLLASLEQSRLESDKDQVYVEVLDRALFPRIGKPSRTVVVVVAVVAGFVFSLAYIFGAAAMRKMVADYRAYLLRRAG